MSDNDCKCGKCGDTGLVRRNIATFGGKPGVTFTERCTTCGGIGRKVESDGKLATADLLVGKAKGGKTCDTKRHRRAKGQPEKRLQVFTTGEILYQLPVISDQQNDKRQQDAKNQQ